MEVLQVLALSVYRVAAGKVVMKREQVFRIVNLVNDKDKKSTGVE